MRPCPGEAEVGQLYMACSTTKGGGDVQGGGRNHCEEDVGRGDPGGGA